MRKRASQLDTSKGIPQKEVITSRNKMGKLGNEGKNFFGNSLNMGDLA
ncbi:MAG: hypothetical protein JW720_01940 [Sedimentisphaerales bacterium]|nr:hypothetical protein [Sedimentisphaerales bacterium]